MPLLSCGHRVYCSVCMEKHAFCPLCSRRYVPPRSIPDGRDHQTSYLKKEQIANVETIKLERELAKEREESEREKRAKRERERRVSRGELVTSDTKRKLIPFPTTTSDERLLRRSPTRRV